MPERDKPLSDEHEETIAAFDRERDVAHELSRRSEEIINNSRRTTRIVGRPRSEDDR